MLTQLAIHPIASGFRLLDLIGTPETSDFATIEEATEEKHRRFIFKGATGLSGKETYSELQDRLYSKVRESFLPLNKDGYRDGWVKDFDGSHIYYTTGQKMFAVEYTDDSKTGLSFGIPVEVRAKTVYEKVSAFSLGSFAEFAKVSGSGSLVAKEGKIFEAADYPDKGVSISEADLEAMVSGFTEVHNDLEHMDTILDGKLGKLEKVWRKGKELFGRVTVPEWIADAAAEDPIKVSIALNKEKKIVGNALVLNPRVSDACIMRAFSNREAQNETKAGKNSMKIRDLLKAVFNIGAAASLDDDIPEGTAINTAAFSALTANPEQTAMEQELAGFRAREKARRTSAVDEAATAFSTELVTSGAILPAATEKVRSLYRTALAADGEAGEVRFSEGGSVTEGENVTALREVLGAKTAGGPVSLAGATAFAGAPGTGDEGEDGKKILAATSFGREAAKKAGGA